MRLNICSASHFIHASAYGYVSLTIKEDPLKVWYDYVVGKFWLFVDFVDFDKKGFALSVFLNVRVFGTRKWPIQALILLSPVTDLSKRREEKAIPEVSKCYIRYS